MAVDSDSEEARTAAKQACFLIQKYDLLGKGPSIEEQLQLRVAELVRVGELVRVPSKWKVPSGHSTLLESADACVEAFMQWLSTEERYEVFPRMTSIQITSKAIREGVISSSDGDTFRRYLKRYLKVRVDSGDLVSYRRGGFGLFDG
jgi:hypothetical protein